MKNLCLRLFGLVLSATLTVQAAPPIPDVLKPWEEWATWNEKHRWCPTPYSSSSNHLCFWPSRLGLQAEKAGGKFDLVVDVFGETWVPLPGSEDTWPVEVKVNGAPVPVVEQNGGPAVQLFGGTVRIEGAYRWSEVPQRIRIPREIGILGLVLDGQPVEAPAWDTNGFLWLKRDSSTEETDKNFLAVKLYAALEDDIPLWLYTEVELTVSGKSREEDLGTILPEGWRLASVESQIPVAVDEKGHAKAQVRAGKWTVQAAAFRFDNPKEVRYAPGAKPAASEQLMAFRARTDFRTVEIVGAPSIDVSQTTFPSQWRDLPVYRWETSTAFQIEERMRGMGDQKPAGLTISRELWLDEDGRTLTFRDEVRGAMQQIWRLDAAAGQDLGSIRVEGQGQLITRNPKTGAPGVEVRTRAVDLEATGRTTRTAELSASGWQTDANSVRVALNLPPGWRLFALFGADWVQGDWLTAWTLLDLFLLLVFSMAVGRLWGIGAGLLAFLAFGLAYHEPGAPRYLWLILLVPLALQRVVPPGWGSRLVGLGKWIAVGAFVLVLAPFVARQVQQALYPQLEPQAQFVTHAAPRGERESAEEDWSNTSHTYGDPADAAGTARINNKLQKIIIPKLELRDATIQEALDFLQKRSAELDTDPDVSRRGVNFVLKVESAPGSVAPPAPGIVSTADTRISVALTNIPLIEAVKYVTSLANLKYKIEPYAIAILPVGTNTLELIQKEYIVPPDFLTRIGGPSGATNPAAALKSAGVTFPEGATAVYFPARGRLLVRNSQENLDLIETLVGMGGPASRSTPAIPGLEAAPAGALAAAPMSVLDASSAGYARDNLLYDAKARIQTGPGVPEWEWRKVSFGWNGPVAAAQQVKPVLISLTVERLLNVSRVVLLLVLAGVLLGARKLGGTVFRASGKAAAMLVFFSSVAGASAQSPIPDQRTLETLRERLLKKSDAYPNAADIPLVTLTLADRKLTLDAEIHAATRTAVPLPGRLPTWSPLTVLVDDKPEVALRREGGFLWVVLEAGVHRVHVEGSLASVTEWEWTFLLKPRQVKIDAPGWTVTGVKPNGMPEAQVFFALKQKVEAAPGATTYERQEVQTIVVVERRIELGLIWQVNTTVARLSPTGKAVAVRVPLLPGENVLSSNAIVKDGFIEVRLGAQEHSSSWESGLAVVKELKLATRPEDTWVERWRLVASPVWNVAIGGLPPVFEPGHPDLVPVWRPWPGESVDLAISRPEAMAGATMTVSRGLHTVTLGQRQRTSQLELSLRCSLGEDFLVELPAVAEITTLTHQDKTIPVRKDGNKLVIPVRPGEQRILIAWKTNVALGTHAQVEEVRLPVESANLHTTITVPQDRWVLWANGPQRGPAVRFWGILICSLLAAIVLGRVGRSPLHTVAWMLLAIGLTQVPLPAALVVVGWLFFLSWRGSESFRALPNIGYNLLQLVLMLLTAVAIGILFFAVGEGLLGNPKMFIVGNGSDQVALRWFQPRSGNLLPQPECFSISIWWYRFFMLAWALWLAAALIHWLRWGWKNFGTGGFFRRKPKKVSPPPLPA